MPTSGGYKGSSGSGAAAVSSTPAYTYDQTADSQIVPGLHGPSSVGGFGTSSTMPANAAIVALAKELGINGESSTSGDVTTQVIAALAQKYGVRVDEPGSIGSKKISGGRGGSGSRAGGVGGQVSETEISSTPPGANPKVLAEIAKKVGAKGDSLGDIANAISGKGGVSDSTAAAFRLGANQTVGQARTAFYNSLTANPNDPHVKAIVAGLEQAGYLASDINGSNPNTHDITHAFNTALTDAVNNKVDPATQIQNKMQEVATPAAGQTSSEAYAAVQDISDKYGVGLDAGTINSIVTKYGAANVATNIDQIKQDVVSRFDPTKATTSTGVAIEAYNAIKQEALALQIPMSDLAIGNLVKQGLLTASDATILQAKDIIVGEATQTLRHQAEGMYPTIATQIAAGMNTTDIVDPYNQIAGTYLGVDPKSIQTNDPSGKWGKFLDGGTDPKTGQKTMMTMDQWKKTIMSDPQYGFDKTEGAKNMAGNFTSALLNSFGLINTGGGTTFSEYTNSPGSANTT